MHRGSTIYDARPPSPPPSSTVARALAPHPPPPPTSVLQVRSETGAVVATHNVLNEVVIDRGAFPGAVLLEIHIDQQYVTTGAASAHAVMNTCVRA